VSPELTIIAVTALMAGLLLVGIMLAGRGPALGVATAERALAHGSPPRGVATDREPPGAETTLRVVWWLTITIVLLGVGISGSFAAGQGPIFLLGAAAVGAVVAFHEVPGQAQRGRTVRVAEVVVAIALIGGLLALTGFASSPFAMLFALVAVAAALAYGPRAGLAAAGLATAAFAAILLVDPSLAGYGPDDVLRLSIGLGATWLLAFVSIAYAEHQRRAMRRYIDLARTDGLTGLYNRAQLFTTLEQEVSRTRRSDRGFCVLMIDLDGLKLINDSAGHLRGDAVLKGLASVIAGSIRTVDSAYRYGGDEFVVLLPETDIVGAFVVAEKIRAGAEEVGLGADDEPITSVSIGLVSHPEDGATAEELMSAADRAMYQAKRLGKNQISGNPRPRPALLGRRSVVAQPPLPAPPDEGGGPAEESRPIAQPPARSGPKSGATAPSEERAVPVELGPVRAEAAAAAANGADEEDEADAQTVRRQIAAASRSFDPDHQIRRAMDAFLSPTPVERDASGREH
jgi:diguanylate cyclase (GGDEF)-like protein